MRHKQFIQELSEQLSQLFSEGRGFGQNLGAELNTAIHDTTEAAVQKTLARFDILRREEFEQQFQALERAEQRISALEQELQRLEQRLDCQSETKSGAKTSSKSDPDNGS